MNLNISIINGPNLNLLGYRESAHYGKQTLESINNDLELLAQEQSIKLHFFQTNSEEKLVNEVQKSPQKNIDFIILNAAAYTHTSIALRDSLLAVKIPFIEVHLSNIYARESFRHKSYLSDIAVGVITGLGTQVYSLALTAALDILSFNPNECE